MRVQLPITLAIIACASIVFLAAGCASPQREVAWGSPATSSMNALEVFTRLVDMENRYVACRPAVEAEYRRRTGNGQGSLPYRERDALAAEFGSCAKGEPRPTCGAPISAARHAQFFFNRYYRDIEPRASDTPLQLWADRCQRSHDALPASEKVGISSACSRSLLLLPLAQPKNPPEMRRSAYPRATHLPIGWGGFNQGTVTCGDVNFVLIRYYSTRCRNIQGMANQWKGIQPNYNVRGNLVGEYYDEVDWDFCRVLVSGVVDANLDRLRL
ncbi:MAG TPA: hypothetical protein VJ798_02075 [Rhizomicrobium sp.]|nr:hypothetical protein [Rhizomicrobium sp.]